MDTYNAVYTIQGWDFATVYMDARTCNGGTHNDFQCKVRLQNSDGSTVEKTSKPYTNEIGRMSTGEARANNRDAVYAFGYARSYCNICRTGYGNTLNQFTWTNF